VAVPLAPQRPGEAPGACVWRLAGEGCGSEGQARLQRLADAQVGAAAGLARCSVRLDEERRGAALDLEVCRTSTAAQVADEYARRVELEAVLAGLDRPPPAPRPALASWGLGAGGAAVVALGVACLVVDGCPAAAGWSGVAAGAAGVAVGFGLAR
jgi:hypothetical protein